MKGQLGPLLRVGDLCLRHLPVVSQWPWAVSAASLGLVQVLQTAASPADLPGPKMTEACM